MTDKEKLEAIVAEIKDRQECCTYDSIQYKEYTSLIHFIDSLDGEYWFVTSEGNVQKSVICENDYITKFRMQSGNFYATKEEAEKYVDFVKKDIGNYNEPVNYFEFRDYMNPFYERIKNL